ncbi:oligosaccharide flippase family protein [Modestobacter versicolor]|uniref:oligosaccharide flippase family protein n=1 Tax=Modestobacter versicolor TaxID=429133 RepID=UPI0034DF896C
MTSAEQDVAAARNSMALVLSRVVVAGLAWGGSVIVARALSSEEWGQFSFVFGLLGLMAVVTDLGIGRVVLGRLMQDRADTPDVASSYIALRTVLGLLGYLIAIAVVFLGGYPGEVVAATAVAGLVVVLATPGNALTVLLQSRLRLTVSALAEAVAQVVQLAATVAAALFAPFLLVFLLPAVLREVVLLLLKLRAVRRGAAGPPPSGVVHAWRWRAMLVDAVPLTIGLGLFTLMSRVDLLVLSKLDTFESIGLYSIGVRFADALGLVGWALLAPTLTILVGAWPDDLDRFRDRVRHVIGLVTLVGSLAVVGFWAVADPLVVFLFGARFVAATDAAQLLVLGAAIAMLTLLGLNVLMAMGRHRAYVAVAVLGLVLTVVLTLVLVPIASFEGAAVAGVLTDVLLCAAMWAVVASGPVRGLVPWRTVGTMAVVVASCVALDELAADRLPWLVLAVATTVLVLLAGALLRLPGAELLRRRPSRARH